MGRGVSLDTLGHEKNLFAPHSARNWSQFTTPLFLA